MKKPLSPSLVLAVDDDPLVLDLIELALLDGGFGVRTATSAALAIAVLEAEASTSLAALVTDVNLGAGSGWDVGRRARELQPSLPVMYVSGDSLHEWHAHGVKDSRMLAKPFVIDDLIGEVAAMVSEAGRRSRPIADPD